MKATSGKFDLHFGLSNGKFIHLPAKDMWMYIIICTSSCILYNKEEWSAVIAEAQFCGTMPLDHKEGKDTEVPSGMAERTQLCCESFVAV